MTDRAGRVSRDDYLILVIIAGAACLVASLLAGGELAFFVAVPLSIVLIGTGVALTKRNGGLTEVQGLAKYRRPVMFGVSMLLFLFFAYVLVVLFL